MKSEPEPFPIGECYKGSMRASEARGLGSIPGSPTIFVYTTD
jgi:hypothetical protein